MKLKPLFQLVALTSYHLQHRLLLNQLDIVQSAPVVIEMLKLNRTKETRFLSLLVYQAVRKAEELNKSSILAKVNSLSKVVDDKILSCNNSVMVVIA